MKKEETNKVAMSEDAALSELNNYIRAWVRKPPSIDELKEEYPETLDAIMEGRLIINENKEPILKLIHPTDGEFGRSELVFKTRMKVSTRNSLLKNINSEKEAAKGGTILMAHMFGLDTVNELDLIHPWDYKAAAEIASVFM